MAKLTPGALISGASGAQGTIVFSHNRGGMYSRARVTPANPSTTPQVTWRAAVKRAAQRWGTSLSAATRLSWQSYAKELTRPSTLSRRNPMCGYTAYVSANSYAYWCVGGTMDTPPGSPVFPVISAITFTCGVAAHSLQIGWTATPAVANSVLAFFCSQPLGAGRLSPNGTWGYVVRYTANQSHPRNAWAEYVLYHTAPTAGQRIFIRAWAIDRTTWIPSPYVVSACTCGP